MLPSLASLEELEDRLAGGISSADEARAQAALDDASALIRQEAGKTWVDDPDSSSPVVVDVPDIIVTICLTAAKRAFLNPDGKTQEKLGDYSFAVQAGDIGLTSEEVRRVRSAAGRSGLWVQPTTRSDNGLGADTTTIYVDVEGGIDPLPLLSDPPY